MATIISMPRRAGISRGISMETAGYTALTRIIITIIVIIITRDSAGGPVIMVGPVTIAIGDIATGSGRAHALRLTGAQS
jgi:hypothetical protein